MKEKIMIKFKSEMKNKNIEVVIVYQKSILHDFYYGTNEFVSKNGLKLRSLSSPDNCIGSNVVFVQGTSIEKSNSIIKFDKDYKKFYMFLKAVEEYNKEKEKEQ